MLRKSRFLADAARALVSNVTTSLELDETMSLGCPVINVTIKSWYTIFSVCFIGLIAFVYRVKYYLIQSTHTIDVPFQDNNKLLQLRFGGGRDVFNVQSHYQNVSSVKKSATMRSKGKFHIYWISVNGRKVPPKPKCMPRDMSTREWTEYFLRFERDMIPAQTRTCTKSYPFHVLRWAQKNALRFLDIFDRWRNADSESKSSSSSSLSMGDCRSTTLSKVKAGPFRLRRARAAEDDSSEWSNTELNTGSESESSDSEKRTPVKVTGAVTGRRPRGRPKGSKTKKSSKFAPAKVPMLPRKVEWIVERRRQERENRLRRRDDLRAATGR